MKVVVCSAGRAQILRDKTLVALARGGFTGELHIVVPFEEVMEYTMVCGSYRIWGAPKGLCKQRQFARNLFGREEEIVFMDDDITAVKIKLEGRLWRVNLNDMFSACFAVMKEVKASMWGVYPVCNRDWMSNTIDSENAYVVGALYGIVNSIPHEGEDDEKEDWERQLKLIVAGGKAIRFREFGIITRYWRGDTGGIQRTPEGTQRIVDRLVATYPGLVKPTVRRNGKLDLKFVGRPVSLSLPSPPPCPRVLSESEEAEPEFPSDP